MLSKPLIVLLIIFYFLCSSCQKEPGLHENIEVEVVEIKKENKEIIIKSRINKFLKNITEHGHCWSSEIPIPTIDSSPFTSLGPLELTEYEEVLEFKSKSIYVRPFIIVNSYIVYGEVNIVDAK